MCLTWTDDQVYEAWNIIAEEGKLRKSNAAARLKEELVAGDKVCYNGRNGTVSGTVMRVKRKKAIVEVSGQCWNVPLSMLKKI